MWNVLRSFFHKKAFLLSTIRKGKAYLFAERLFVEEKQNFNVCG
jgi:hypothetical protein